jgi:hypothetical protein
MNNVGIEIIFQSIFLKKMSITPKDINIIKVEYGHPIDENKDPFRVEDFIFSLHFR